ncbi:hypothetical protein [Sphingomonas sp. PAMC 26617]|uniref:hypothetical protein n=1 Tax=Sphingomonas sp. PAMC 26617 TaxID=1112216 RepID=UPI000287F422|nr:hypothetical protein [Sphingomonas sp. PAMC 26617]
MNGRLIFRHLSFIGTAKTVSTLPFVDGTNVIYGASNTGKSFTLAALQFMLGKSTPLPAIEQLDGYEAVLLGLDVPSMGPVTLYRGIQGAGFRLYEGLHHEAPQDVPFRVLDAEYDARTENITSVILGALGLSGKFVVKNENGEKNSVTLRSLDPFTFVDEGSIIDARSPILSGQYTSATAEKNLFRLLLTGRDDSAIVAVVPPKIRKARQEGQKELLEEWIAALDAQIDAIGIPRQQLDDQSKRIEASLTTIQGDLAKRQRRIDEVTRERRRMVDEADRVTAQAREIELTLARFARLMEVYESDVERLEALEQGGHLLLARLDRPCPLCGAEVDHQHHHGRQDVERSRVAARVEIARIDRERRDLVATMNGLETDFATNLATSERLRRRMAAAERILGVLRPEESGLRDEYEQRIEARDTVRERLKLFEERDRLAVQLSQVTTAPTAAKPKLTVGIDGPTGHEFASKVSEVLQAWKFPGNPTVSFDSQTQDIRLDGKERGANGKGVRAILHSAFKVAVLLYCQDKGLFHPGVLALDTPLLTYREPIRVPRHGALAADEKKLAATTLYEHFYLHLASLSGRAQFIILENSDPPSDLMDRLSVQTFTGDLADGRSGLLPPANSSPTVS